MLQVGSKAPSFEALSTKGRIDLKQLLGEGNVLLIFYPKNNTPG